MHRIHSLTDDNLATEVLTNPAPMLLRFGSPGCIPCKAFNPHLMALADRFTHITFYGCNADNSPQAVDHYHIQTVPTFLFVYQQQVVDIYGGPLLETSLAHWLQVQLEPILLHWVVDTLRAGDTVIFPTETVYALAAEADNPQAVRKIYHHKQRDPQKPCSIFLPQLAQLDTLVSYNVTLHDFVLEHLQQGETLVFSKKSPELLPNIPGNQVGIRLPQHDFCQKLLKLMATPLVATSANLSGQAELLRTEELRQAFPTITCLVESDWLLEPGLRGKPSRVISVAEGVPQVLRA